MTQKRLIYSLTMKALAKAMNCVMVLWLAVAMAAAGLPGIVLCIGADGHFSIEAAHEGRCRSEADAHDHGSPTGYEFVPKRQRRLLWRMHGCAAIV